MKILVLGASGATGRHLVEQLLYMKQQIKIIIRPSANIPDDWINNAGITIIKTDVSKIMLAEAINHTKDCVAVASCLGHGTTLNGIFGQPRKLVTNTVKVFCKAIEANATNTTVKFVLMNTAGYRNKDVNEQISTMQKIVMGFIRTVLPPHLDNEMAADFLRVITGQLRNKIQWVIVRPDDLVNEDTVSLYDVHNSPVTTLFSPRKVSRINVAYFMASLITDNYLWEEWKGKMPVIYNR